MCGRAFVFVCCCLFVIVVVGGGGGGGVLILFVCFVFVLSLFLLFTSPHGQPHAVSLGFISIFIFLFFSTGAIIMQGAYHG